MKLTDIFKMLTDETRIRILNILKETDLCVCEVQAILDISQTNASKHLNKLKGAGFIADEKKSQWSYYCLNDDFWNKHEQLYQYLKYQWDTSDCYIKDLESLREYKSKNIICT
ncbi:ArsR/SmtB family transcription factor [Pectinatus frisingensis]|uniref:ArsR/SmtB family transcription factor n=1 Tax=Pectinatus frisingensis TaxID=865 RepID=UPI0018C4AAEC|nr:metalloregulator ArsR/SmtB family transcription factor [Pectinatus frisingensis]